MSTPLRERPDAPLGTLIFRAGLLPAETIESALEEGVKTGKRLGEILTERGLLKEVDLARLLAGQKGLEFVPVREHIVDPDAASLFTHDQARLFRALPYAFEEGVPVVAIPDPTDEVVLRNIREALGRDEVRFVVSTRGEIAEIVEDVYSKPLPAPGAAAPEPPAPTPAAEEPGFVRNPEPPSAPTPEALPEQAANGNGASADAAPPLEIAPAAPTPAPELAPPLEVVEPSALEPALASAPVEEHVVPESPVAAEPSTPSEPEVDPEPVLHAEPEVAQVEPVTSPEPILHAEPEVAQVEPVTSPEPVLHAEPEVAQVEPVTSPEPALSPEPETAPEPVTSRVPLPAPEPAHAPEPQAPAEPAPAPVPMPEPVSPPTPAPYPPAASAPAAADPLPPTGGALYEVTIRLVNGERVEAGTFQELAAAKESARALMAQVVAAAGQGEWPFVNGRFLKPDTIVSVDIAEPAGGAA